jgi:hypothetical protein
MRIVKQLLFIGLLAVAAGCSTVDTQNVDSRPWNRPTKADIAKDMWPCLRPYYYPGSSGEYP